jgi:putative transposase
MLGEKASFPVAFMCRQLGVSRSGFYAWRQRRESRRAAENRALLIRIRTVFDENRRSYGSPSIYRALRDSGHRVGRHRIAKLMRLDGIRARRKPRYVATTNSKHSHRCAPNLLARRFTATAPNTVWATDFTYIPTREGWLYLAVVLDLYSRRVVGWKASGRMDQQLTADALRSAIVSRRPPAGLLHHSDRGVQYASTTYQRLLRQHGFVSSMSRKGNCWDNAPVESFFSTLKTELIGDNFFDSRAVGERALFDYIEAFYNRQRRHTTLDYLSPARYEQRFAA